MGSTQGVISNEHRVDPTGTNHEDSNLQPL